MVAKRKTVMKTSSLPIEHNQMKPQRSGPSTVLVILLIVISFFTGFLYFKVQNLEKGGGTAQQLDQQQQQPPTVKVTKEQIKRLFSNKSISFGDANRKVLFVEISDPSCPYCHVSGGLNSAAIPGDQFKYKSEGGTYVPPVPEMRKLVEEGKASYVTMYADGHGNGKLAMQALYCAHDKGKFWETHDLLMTQAGYEMINTTVKNDKTKIPQLTEYLNSAVDAGFLSECLQSDKYASRLEEDKRTAATLGFQGTPHFFVNETAFGGAQPYSAMESAVNAALK